MIKVTNKKKKKKVGVLFQTFSNDKTIGISLKINN